MKKKILSIFLAAVMLLGLFPASAFADGQRSQRESFMAMAESQLGYREKGQNGTKYGSWYGLPNQPWCAMFVSWCARYSGVPGNVIPTFASCSAGVRWFKERGLWRDRAYTPQAGDLLFIDGLNANGVGDGLPEHIAIVERADETTIYTIEGNSVNDMVERRERPRDNSVLGYATPQYGSISSIVGTIRLTDVRAPYSHLRGGDFNISGTAKSNSLLIWLYADIRNLDGDFYCSKRLNPNSKTADLNELNSGLDFASLGPGSYELYIEAVDSSYNYLQKRYSFKVDAVDVYPGGKHADYAEGIQWVIDEGISNGTSAARFMPDAACTRAQVVTFLWRAAGRPAPKSETSWFYDVKFDSYCGKAVQWAVEQGITAGVSRGYFAPDRKVTRAEFVTFLWRYLGKTEPGCENPFVDVQPTNFYFRSVLWAVENGVTSGINEYTFAPDRYASRAQVATFIYRALNPKAPVDPVEPVDPVDPVEPTEPVEPVEPTEPVEPVEPTEPVESPEPTDSAEAA